MILQAEGVVKLQVEFIEALVDGDFIGPGVVFDVGRDAHGFDGLGEIGVAAAFGAGDDRGGDCGAEGAGLGAAGDDDGAVHDIGINLHGERATGGDAAAIDDVFYGEAVLFEAFHDDAG